MSKVTPIYITVQEPAINKSSISDLYKELENIRQKKFFKRDTYESSQNHHYMDLSMEEFYGVPQNNSNNAISNEIHFRVFQNSMKIVYVCGQILGLNSVTGILETNASKMSFQWRSMKFLYSVVTCLIQTIFMVLNFYIKIRKPLSISSITSNYYHVTLFGTTINFIKIAQKWPSLMIKLSTSRLEQYIDHRVKFKCFIASIICIISALFIHILRVFDRISMIKKDYETTKDGFELYAKNTFPLLFEINFPYNRTIGILVTILSLWKAMIWNYPHMFVVCVSLYLTSILKEINKRIVSFEGKCLLSSYWQSLREDYNRATQMIHAFDEVISSVIFSSLTDNMFFACFQVYYIFSSSNTYEHSIYFLFTGIISIVRLLSVAFAAAEVNTASLLAAPSLYNTPALVYCTEVERFIDQCHDDTVALSGNKFFYVTREFVLSIVGAIITYELVLIQLNGDYILKD